MRLELLRRVEAEEIGVVEVEAGLIFELAGLEVAILQADIEVGADREVEAGDALPGKRAVAVADDATVATLA